MQSYFKWSDWIIGFLCLLRFCDSLNNGLALTPPMGWMSWQRYRCNVDCYNYPNDCLSEMLIKRIADLMVSEGYKDAGYEYLIIDDCWLNKTRGRNGELLEDAERFPSGMKNLSNYIHGKGLKFGIYQDFGNFTCAGYPGLFGHLEQDAQTFADWDVDYIKVDTCYSYDNLEELEDGYSNFGQMLNKTGRQMVYSCSWPAYFELSSNKKPNYDILKQVCNLWRNYGDIEDDWSDVLDILDWFAANQERFASYAGPGQWNDPDMLLLGNYGLSYEQSKSQMVLWAILAAPLLMSADLAEIRPEIKDILQNKDIIEINQDALGIQGTLILTKVNINVWMKPIQPVVDDSQSYAVAFLGRMKGGYPYRLVISLNELQINSSESYMVTNILDPYKEGNVVLSKDEFVSVTVKPSGVVLLKFVPVEENKNLLYSKRIDEDFLIPDFQ
ncbi:alpha-N-acetylgalactosaminidase isoform X2 [Agrilus planipennis]|nr:alpha-N-acetylgalactosaminidase isoform X2 [Agrilus planipennis]XP_025837628.1 alpha-N-acetylgalactosaminidase isoform X2 [Agrilus planipennis]XP_025837629.1 alpha-N-acetylgalactosaminidase isoform X2 [Agrilus planipennis]XP_025837630.1 alpha-N-acetylgalactosaminidase isoform X2 [Agrilus planipennis]XP_025837631.1 alpha-N-acetylgalactosaminidase isoform X2 [Agrilus planipennis]XP_025837632.1 alpha-N-acetylgalactosaminidase isoform X2 [Agrilus planipennis]